MLSHQDRPGQQPGLLLDPLSWEGFPEEEGPGPVDRAAPQEGDYEQYEYHGTSVGTDGCGRSPAHTAGATVLEQEQDGAPQPPLCGRGRAEPLGLSWVKRASGQGCPRGGSCCFRSP